MRGFGQDPMWAINCMAQGGIPDPHIGCVPAAVYPQIKQCVDAGGTYDPYTRLCIPKQGVAKGAFEQAAAAIMCMAMQGQWDQTAMECKTPDQTYGINSLSAQSLPPESCPAGQINTPLGCKPFPVPSPPVGRPSPGMAPPPGVPPQPDSAQVSAAGATTTPSWVVPAVIGVGALAAVLFFTRG